MAQTLGMKLLPVKRWRPKRSKWNKYFKWDAKYTPKLNKKYRDFEALTWISIIKAAYEDGCFKQEYSTYMLVFLDPDPTGECEKMICWDKREGWTIVPRGHIGTLAEKYRCYKDADVYPYLKHWKLLNQKKPGGKKK